MYKIIKITLKRIKGAPISACFLIFGLTLSMLMISICTSYVAEIINMQSNKIKSAPPNALMFSLNLNKNSQDKIPIEKITNLLSNIDKRTGIFLTDLLLNIDNAGVDNYFSASAEWFHSDTGWHYPVYEGRYYSVNEIKSGAKVVLVGSNIKKYIQKKDGQSYIKIFGEQYKVIGVVGFKGGKSLWDSRLFLPMTSLPKLARQTIEAGIGSFVIYNANWKTPGEIEKIKLKSKEFYPKVTISDIKKIGSENMVSNIASNLDMLLIIGILGYIVSLIYAVNMVSFWIEQRRYEIGVRKAFGHTNFSIASLIFQEMLGISLLSLILGFIIQTILSAFTNEIMGYTTIMYIQNIIVGLVAIVLTAILTSVWPIIKSLKIQPIEAMKL
jgi:putative ABC transport system permease protein